MLVMWEGDGARPEMLWGPLDVASSHLLFCREGSLGLAPDLSQVLFHVSVQLFHGVILRSREAASRLAHTGQGTGSGQAQTSRKDHDTQASRKE